MQKVVSQMAKKSSSYDKTDFQCVLYPFLKIFKFCGFVPLKLNKPELFRNKNKSNPWDFIALGLSILAFGAWLVGGYLAVYTISVLQNCEYIRQQSSIAYCAIWLNIFTSMFLAVVAWITCWWKMEDLLKLFAVVFEIDGKLKLWFNMKFKYQQLKILGLIIFGILLIVPAVFSMIDCVIVMPLSRIFSLTSTCYWCLCFIPIFLFTCKQFQFVMLLLLLKAKFVRINDKLRQYIEGTLKEEESVKLLTHSNYVCFEELPTVDSLKKLLHIYSLTSDGVELVMDVFAWHLLLSTTAAICIITIQAYYLFAQGIHAISMHPHHIIMIIIWLIFQIANVAINIAACNTTAKSMSLTSTLLHKLRVELKSETETIFWQIVQIFSLEVLQRKNKFTADGYIDINNRLITSIFSAVTTYLIILIQFHLGNL